MKKFFIVDVRMDSKYAAVSIIEILRWMWKNVANSSWQINAPWKKNKQRKNGWFILKNARAILLLYEKPVYKQPVIETNTHS